MIIEKLIQYRKKLGKEIHQLHKKINEYPKGKLICNKNGKYVKWFQYSPNHKVYIPKTNSQLAEQLAQKNYYLYKLEDLMLEQKAVEFHIRTLSNNYNKVDKFLTTPSEELRLFLKNFKPLNQELADWASSSYPKNPRHKESLIHRTVGGNFVRSKSEACIYAALTKHNIPFHYEECLSFDNFDIYPDFTIRHPITGKTIIWEHFGAMDLPTYQRSTLNKLQTYMLNGYFPGDNLIMTFENKLNPLDPFYVEKMIQYYFEEN